MLDLQIFLLVVAGLAEDLEDEREIENWINFNGFDYLFVDVGFTGFIEAESYCVNRSAHLASIHSQRENDFILNLVPNKFIDAQGTFLFNMWIGAYATEAASINRNWRWTDGTNWNYTHWDNGEPNNHQGIEYCVFMYTRQSNITKAGNWSDYKCHGELLYYVCKRPARNSSSSHCLPL